MSARSWYGIAAFVLLLALANACGAWFRASDIAPRLVVIARHALPEHHKITDSDVMFAIRRVREVEDAVARPGDALGTCTRTALPAQTVPRWLQLDPSGTGDGSCASPALALDMLTRAMRLPDATAAAASKSGAATIAPLSEWLKIDVPPSELSAGNSSALGELRAEFTKEFAKRLADNAGDHIFGRDRKDASPPSAPSPGPPLPAVSPPPVSQPPASQPPPPVPTARYTTVQFGVGQSQLAGDMRAKLNGFTAELRPLMDCHFVVEAFTDATGGPEQNQRLAWLRGGAVADLLTGSGIAAKTINVVPHVVAATGSGKPDLNDRRADIQAICASK
jgi:outer membrane protein OmpA-like peptidoglycan-associated protein